MYCLDTSVAIDFLNGDQKTREKIAWLKAKGVVLSTTPLTLCELYEGAFLSKQLEKNTDTIESFSRTLNLLSFDEQSAFLFGKIKAELKKTGKPAPAFDLAIAAIAIRHENTVLTHDKGFLKIPGLKIELLN